MSRYLSWSLFLLLLCGVVSRAADTPVERLAEAVKFRTVSLQDREQIDYGEFLRMHRFLESSYPRVFAQLDVEKVNEYSLLIRWPGSEPELPAVLFTAHTDVVPVEPGTEDDWDYPAFAGVVANGRIYGRGTLDDKQGVLSLLEAAESLLADGFVPRRTLVFAFGHDEEISGHEGAEQLAARMKELGLHFAWMVDEGGFILSDEPMMPGKSMGVINVAEKGYLTLTLSTSGEGGHSSRPPKISTIGRLSAALKRIEDNPFPARLVVPVEAMLETIGPHAEQPNRFIFNNLWLTGGVVANQMGEDPMTMSFVRTTTALTMFNSGVKENVVPQHAEARVNFRLLPGDTAESVVEYVTGLVNDPLVTISYDRWYPASPVSDHEGEGFNTISEAVASVYPEAVMVPSLLFAITDTKHYVDLSDNQYRFHGMMIDESAQASSIHGTNEYIGVESYENAIRIARRMMKLAGQ